jgi:hypothetical protein
VAIEIFVDGFAGTLEVPAIVDDQHSADGDSRVETLKLSVLIATVFVVLWAGTSRAVASRSIPAGRRFCWLRISWPLLW